MNDPQQLLDRLLLGTPPGQSPLRHVELVPARTGRAVPWPDWTPALLRERLAVRGVAQPWSHQAQAACLAYDGCSVVVATGTASGKSLAYQLPGLAAIAADERARVLYLSPTKALAADQLSGLTSLALPGVRPATFDGDTPRDERDWVRAHANWVLTNPDMLHRTMLPAHQRWAPFLRRLRYVVVDECHTYRGLFGSHVSQILRRLRRVCAAYGAQPVFVLASATTADPAVSASRLIGAPVAAVTEDGSPRGPLAFALWEPPLTALRGEHDAPVRRAAGAEAARLLADLVVEDARTLAFVRSRRGAELTAAGAARALRESGLEAAADRVAAYRAGYLPEERRALEAALDSGALLGVAATNALELGMDIAGLDAVVLAGFPGTIASLWQQAGRAGRAQQPALAIFVARDDPLDTYLVHHPAAVFGRPVEAAVADPENPYVLGAQLCCAAAELPIRETELRTFATTDDAADSSAHDSAHEPTAAPIRAALDALVAQGVLRRRPTGWYWTGRDRPQADIRGTGGGPVAVIDAATGALVGTVDAGAAHATVHPGAVYLHQGRTYVVDALELPDSDRRSADVESRGNTGGGGAGGGGAGGGAALVRADEPPWTTTARDVTDIAIVSADRVAHFGPVTACFGVVEVTNQVVSYVRRRLGSGELIDETPLDLPPRQLRTTAVWYTIAQPDLDEVGLDITAVPGAAHAAEHAAIGLLPLFATCDRWDIGGVSTAMHPDTGHPTVFVYDGHPGGAGFAERGHALLPRWLRATRETIDACECPAGCPSCVQSPKCGNGNEPLDKPGALTLLDLVLTHLDNS